MGHSYGTPLSPWDLALVCAILSAPAWFPLLLGGVAGLCLPRLNFPILFEECVGFGFLGGALGVTLTIGMLAIMAGLYSLA